MMSKAGTLNLAGIVRESIVDGPGIRFAVYCQGCPHGCPGCHNPQTHPFGEGKDTDVAAVMKEIRKNPLLSGVTFSGGEPFCQPKALLSLAKEVKKNGLDIVIFTGYTYEELLDMSGETPAIEGLLSLCDILIDGRFIESQRDLSLRFRGSRNQRIIDVQATRKKGDIILSPDHLCED